MSTGVRGHQGVQKNKATHRFCRVRLIPHRQAPFNSLQQERQYWWHGEWKDSLLPSLFSTSQMNSVIKLLLVMTANWIETIGRDTAPSYGKRKRRMDGCRKRMVPQTQTRVHIKKKNRLTKPHSLLNGTSGGLARKAVAHFFLVFNYDLQWRSSPLRVWTPLWLRAQHISLSAPWRLASLALHPDRSTLRSSQTTVMLSSRINTDTQWAWDM